MVLGFKTQIKGRPTGCVEKIIHSLAINLCAELDKNVVNHLYQLRPDERPTPKIHTLRESDRFCQGDTIHFATGVRTSKYYQFAKAKCTGKQYVLIHEHHPLDHLTVHVLNKPDEHPTLFNKLYFSQIAQLARHDGFPGYKYFDEWFRPQLQKAPDKTKVYTLIHWTDHRYTFPRLELPTSNQVPTSNPSSNLLTLN